jgi:DnaJ-class molecular chaperone
MAGNHPRKGADATTGLYGVLGVAPGASPQAIVHAYRQAARSSHPDARPHDPDAVARFRRLTNAYEVLSDPVRRADYDRARLARASQRPASERGGAADRRPRADQTGEAQGFPRPSGERLVDARRPRTYLWAGQVRVETPFTHSQVRWVGRLGIDALASALSRYLGDGRWSK